MPSVGGQLGEKKSIAVGADFHAEAEIEYVAPSSKKASRARDSCNQTAANARLRL